MCEGVIGVGELRLETATGRVVRPGRMAHLTPRQKDVLRYLMERAGEPQTDMEILKGVWGETAQRGERHVVRQHVRGIRLKIEEEPGKPKYLVTVVRYGYMVSMGVETES